MEGFAALVVVVLLNIVVTNILYKIFIKGTKNGCLYLMLCIVTVVLIPSFFLALYKCKRTMTKETEPLKGIEYAPTEPLVDKYMELIEKYGIDNTPQSWNKVRGIWFVVNESPDIPTEKKRILRNFLMTKGLRLVGNDKNIIDNYKK